MQVDVFGFVQFAADREQALGVGGAADFPNGVRIGRLYANFKLEQSAANRLEKFDHLIVNQVSSQFKMEVGDAVVMFRKILPDCHGIFFGTVEGPVYKFDLTYPCIQKLLQPLEYHRKRHVANPSRYRGETVTAPERTAADGFKVKNLVGQRLQIRIRERKQCHVKQRCFRVCVDGAGFIPPYQRGYLLDRAFFCKVLLEFQKGLFPFSAQNAVQCRIFF